MSPAPGQAQVDLKLLFAPDSGRILGAQAMGLVPGVEKRIDVVAMCMQVGGKGTACMGPGSGWSSPRAISPGLLQPAALRWRVLLQMGGTVFDLEEAELCYGRWQGGADRPSGTLLSACTPRRPCLTDCHIPQTTASVPPLPAQLPSTAQQRTSSTWQVSALSGECINGTSRPQDSGGDVFCCTAAVLHNRCAGLPPSGPPQAWRLPTSSVATARRLAGCAAAGCWLHAACR